MGRTKSLSVKDLTGDQRTAVQTRVIALGADPTREQFKEILQQCRITGLSLQGSGRLRREMTEGRTFTKNGAAESLVSKPTAPSSSNGHAGLTVETLLPTVTAMEDMQVRMLAVHLFGENDRLKSDIAKQLIDSDTAMESLRQQLMDEKEKSKRLAALV